MKPVQPVQRVRMAIVGVGHMGRLHAQKMVASEAEDPSLTLVGVADIKLERARRVAALAERGSASRGPTRAVADFHELLPEVDAAIVAVPTLAHFEVVRDLLEAGCDVLVEKPIAANLSEAEALLALAKAGGRVLQVGHLEWFNTAMQVVHEHIDRPRFVEAHRVGPFPDRATDIDVVRDLMIHDLDIVQQLIGEEPLRIEAVGVPVVTPRIDIANARLTYPGGAVANLTASRVSSAPLRKIRFFQRDGYFSIDFLKQSATVYRRVNGSNGTAMIQMEELQVDRGDALHEQLRAFLHAVRTRERPTVDGAGGLHALRTALRVIEAMPPTNDFE